MAMLMTHEAVVFVLEYFQRMMAFERFVALEALRRMTRSQCWHQKFHHQKEWKLLWTGHQRRTEDSPEQVEDFQR